MLGRAAVAQTPLGHSLLPARPSKYLWRELEQLADSTALAHPADRVITGTMNDGYIALWAVTAQALLVLTEDRGQSRIAGWRELRVVLRPVSGVARILLGNEPVALRSTSPELEPFAAELARRAGLPSPAEGLLSSAGLVSMDGDVVHLRGEYLGGIRGLAGQLVAVAIDDAGVHLAATVRPWWQIAVVAWSDVKAARTEGHEEVRQRVTVPRLMTLGSYALAVPRDEISSCAYLTLETAGGEVILRFQGITPQALRLRLGDRLTAVSGSAGGGLVDDLARLAGLHAAGALTDQEFAAAKQLLLNP
jgi:hypothetical protein